MLTMLLGQQAGYTKYPCFLSLWDSRARDLHWTKADWSVRGNYKTGPKVSVFNFPKDEEFRQRWISSIGRKDFQPSKNSKVCELHFVVEDFIKEAHGFDVKAGRVLTAPLSIKKLKKDAFPSIFKGYPDYCCKIARNQRDDPQQKREAREHSAICQAIEESIKEKELYEKSRLFSSLKELDLKVGNFNLSSFWRLIRKDSYLLFAKLIDSPCPQIKYSVQINEVLEVIVFFKNVKRLNVGSYSFPLECRSTNKQMEVNEIQ
ncbi:hypothetical protein AVEN_94425-1 [Araneus ventricosus]|uniref:THAP-type domain-containing protein n=1 Tax=Araneus ventricosus TaxID=182803 RepID=A0A4Y2J2T9_ARAVE|nr:hypothetical protein AVEN_94425-1 [Araneus ventricosus]